MKKLLVVFIVFFTTTVSFASYNDWFFGVRPGTLSYWENGKEAGSSYFWKYGTKLGSQYYWQSGRGPGTKNFWEKGKSFGSSYFWKNSTDPGSEYYWNYGRGPGSYYYWINGTEQSFGTTIVSLCMGKVINIAPCEEMLKNPIQVPTIDVNSINMITVPFCP